MGAINFCVYCEKPLDRSLGYALCVFSQWSSENCLRAEWMKLSDPDPRQDK